MDTRCLRPETARKNAPHAAEAGSASRRSRPELLRKIDAYWRAANYLSVGQIYLFDNPLLKEPLEARARQAAAARPLGHHAGPELHLRPPQPDHQANTT